MNRWIMIAVLIAGVSQAAVVTNFYSDLNDSADGSATAANLNGGTAVGSWTEGSLQESTVVNGMLDAGVGLYAYQLILASDATLSEDVISFHMDFQASAAFSTEYGGAFSTFQLRDTTDDTMISFRTPLGGSLQWYDAAGSSWVTLAATGNSGTTAEAPDAFNSLDVLLSNTGFDVIYNGVTVGTDLVNRGGATLHSISLAGSTATSETKGGSAMWYDNIGVTSVPEPATLGLVGFSALGLFCVRRISRI